MITIGSLNAALRIHNQMVKNLLKLPMKFFDVTPTGRIVQRCSKDVDAIDYILPFCIRSLFLMSIGVCQIASRQIYFKNHAMRSCS